MAGQIAYILTANEAQAVQAFRKTGKTVADTEEATKNFLLEETKRAVQEEAEFGRLAKRVMEEAKSPTDRYYEAVAKLDKLLEQGKISTEAYQKEQKRLADQLDDTGGKAKQAGAAAANLRAPRRSARYKTTSRE